MSVLILDFSDDFPEVEDQAENQHLGQTTNIDKTFKRKTSLKIPLSLLVRIYLPFEIHLQLISLYVFLKSI